MSVETINGKPMTVVKHDIDYATLGRRFVRLSNGVIAIFKDADCLHHIATALPPLPRHPTEKDASLLYLYASHGLYVQGTEQITKKVSVTSDLLSLGVRLSSPILWGANGFEVAWVEDQEGNRVDVAIKEV